MPAYKAPLDDMRFLLNEVLRVGRLAAFADFKEADTDTINAMLSTVAAFSEGVLAPLNQKGDRDGCVHDRETKTVTTPAGFQEAYKQFCDNGLPTISCDPQYGGMGFPLVINTALGEMFCSANMAFAMYPGLSHGAYNAVHEYGTQELKDVYLSNLVTGEWSGTMCLTEPGAGTDLGLIKTKAKKQPDGSYAVTGDKIFISAGEHDLTSNILHLVLARIDDPTTPQGIKGISLFLVPKFIPGMDGVVGERNTVTCGRIEEKMGIHGNSTCELNFEGAKGFLVGEPHKGMKGMFVMMNEARLSVGLQGLALSEAALQGAVAYAQDRTQSALITSKQSKDGAAIASAKIIEHPDVRRMLLTIRSQAEGGRMLAYWAAMQIDISQKHPDAEARKQAKKFVDFLTPIIKAHLTDNAETNTSDGIQVFGGHGFIEEHGMAQLYRDARITRLYEGTNGIQALDLIGRKVLASREGLLPAYLKQVEADLKEARKNGLNSAFTKPVEQAMGKLKWATRRLQVKGLIGKYITHDTGAVLEEAASVATDYLKLASLVAMGHMWVKMADAAHQCLTETAENKAFYETKLKTARFYMEHMMPEMLTHAARIQTGGKSLMDIAAEHFGHGQGTVAERMREEPQPTGKKEKPPQVKVG
jgi:alkylation response protein AidB-like acyl-CoA dehydrogenase